MSIEQLKNMLPNYAKDIKLNLGSVMTPEGAGDLDQKQIYLLALACAFATKNSVVIENIFAETVTTLTDSEVQAAKSAATIMAMNNIYYRFVHLASDKSFATMPAKLRMNIIANPGISKSDFELTCLAISAINGCGMCIDAHINELVKAQVSKLAIQSAIRIAAVINATAQAVAIQ